MPTSVPSYTPNSRKPIERSISQPTAKKVRVTRRRGRVPNEFESDEDIEREVRTDSESDDGHSSLDSESETESLSDDARPNGHSEVVTPSTTQSPPPGELNGIVNGDRSKPAAAHHHGALFTDTTNWAEMVADENANGSSDLPVIDFADLDRHRIDQAISRPPPRTRKAPKAEKRAAAAASPPRATAPTAAPPPPEAPEEEHAAEEPHASSSRSAPGDEPSFRPRGQTARQAYQERLESDPSFVPKVGQFWGHDDRLLDKDLRSLSPWWRGRFQSRGRGRGGFSMRGRGRGGFFQPQGFPNAPGPDTEENGAPNEPEEVPPIEKAWTHDGFEEMKRRDERRRAMREQQQQQQQSPAAPPQRGFGFRGRGGFGRGGFGGRFSPNPSRRSALAASAERPWYAMKPERVWTKQHDIFLYIDPATKPRAGMGPGVRVRLPGGKPLAVVRLPRRSFGHPEADKQSNPSTQEDGEKVVTVRLPRAGKEQAAQPAQSKPVPGTPAAKMDNAISTPRSNVVTDRKVDISAPSQPPNRPADTSSTSTAPVPPLAASKPQPPAHSPVPSVEEAQHQIDLLTTVAPTPYDASSSAQIQESILRNVPVAESPNQAGPSTSTDAARPPPPALPPLQTTFPPALPPTSPPYGSPYGYAPALPPGIAVNHHGMAYDYATGQPVYMQPTPPPMFNPRPMMHAHHPSAGAMPFVPSHMHHHSGASGEFMMHPHTPPMATFIDPSTGMPIFSPARQNSRIEIRAPTDAGDGTKPARPTHPRSGLSMGTPFVPSQPYHQTQYTEQEPAPEAAEDGSAPPAEQQNSAPQEQPAQAPAPMAYVPYPQPYYYPEQYAYAPYPMHYEMYPGEHHQHHPHPPPPPPQPMIYY